MKLKEKIENRDAKVGVIGLGYVGLPLALEFVRTGFHVSGIDISKTKINNLKKKKNYIQDASDIDLIKAVEDEKLVPTNDFSVIKNLDAISICVPTPLNKQKNPDISFINNVISELEKFIHPNILIILESTTYPGTTRELILPKLESKGLIVGENFWLCFSPERIDPGNKHFGTANTPKVLGGITESCTKHGKALYETIVNKVIPVSSPESAEMVKLLENTFRAVNIGLANEVAIMCEKLGINVWEVISAASTKPFGFMKFTPGPGLGGHCIPIDPYYLSWKLKALDYDARFIQLAGQINTSMPLHIFDIIRNSLNTQQKALNGSKILIIGVAYKKNVDDVRESPALDIIKLLESAGVKISYFDPFVKYLNLYQNRYKSLFELTKEQIKKTDAVVIITDHDQINFNLILNNASLIVDTRDVFPDVKQSNLFKLGVGEVKPTKL